MPLGLSPRETTIAFDQLQQQPTAVIPPVSTGEVAAENIAAPFKGIAGGIASTYEALGSAATSAFTHFVVSPLQEQAQRAGAMGMAVPEASVVELDPATVERDQAINSAKVARQFAPDPRTSGTAAQVLNGVTSMGVRMVGGSLITGTPFGGAALVGATEGSQTRDNLIAAGVDRDTADKLALGSAMFSGAGALLPGGVGKTLMTRMLSGSGIQLTAGIANRTMMHVGLEDAGYADMAKQYVPLDGAAMMADAILGSVFGAVHHAFAPDVVDSAHAVRDAVHAERAADGPAVSPESRDAILYNDTRGAEALIAGHDLTGTRDAEVVPDAAQEAARATARTAVDDAAAEAGAARVETTPVEPEGRAPKPFHEMTYEELEAYESYAQGLLRREEDRILGDDADRWRRTRSDDVREQIERAHGVELDSEDWHTLYGSKEGKSRLHPDVYEADPREGRTQEYRSAISEGNVQTPEEAISTLKYALSKLGNTVGNDPSAWTHEQKLAYVTMRQVREAVEEHGWNSKDIQRSALQAAAGRFSDPADAAMMLERFLKKEKPVPQRLALPSPASSLSRAGRAEARARAEGDTMAQLEPDVREALQQAQAVLAQREGMKIGGEDGGAIDASDALRRAIDAIKESAGDDELHRVAAACFGRT